MAIHIHIHKKARDASAHKDQYLKWAKGKNLDPQSRVTFMRYVRSEGLNPNVSSMLEKEVGIGFKANDAAKYVSNIDIRLPSGKIVPHGTVFYKVGANLYRPYFAKPGEMDIRVPADRFVIEDSLVK